MKNYGVYTDLITGMRRKLSTGMKVINWDEKKVIDRENRLIPRRIKETINSLQNANHINKISYMLAEIWLPDLQ